MARAFPLLTKEQIECRVQTVKPKNGVSVLLYKTARTDYEMFDKTFGPMNWQNKYEVINGNLYCSIGVRAQGVPEFVNDWVWKSNCGTESNTEKEKGEASDALKRAGFAWGCGTELYSAPCIWIKADRLEWDGDKLKSRLVLADIRYSGDETITGLTIQDDRGNTVYSWGNSHGNVTVSDTAPKAENAPKRPETPRNAPPAPKAGKNPEKTAADAPTEPPKHLCEICGKGLYRSEEAVIERDTDAPHVYHYFCKGCK